MKISVCCPSYKRPKVKTLDYLPYCKVYVDEGEYDDYVKENREGSNIVKVPKGIQGNVSRIRNYILDTNFKNGMDVVCIIDDDMSYIGYYEGIKSNKVKAEDFVTFIDKYSLVCKEFGYKMWGINLNSDKQCYREYSPFSSLSVVLGPFSCHLKGSECRYDENLPLKEDYDISIQHLNRYRGILRVNKYHYVCKQSENVGGCAIQRNIQREIEQLNLLQKKWGSKIVKWDESSRSHKSNKGRKIVDYNPVIIVPIKGI